MYDYTSTCNSQNTIYNNPKMEAAQVFIHWRIAGITRVLDPNGPEEGLKTRDTRKDSLTQEGNDKTHDQKAGDLNGKFLFLHQAFK
jgi:hypothetical protein